MTRGQKILIGAAAGLAALAASPFLPAVTLFGGLLTLKGGVMGIATFLAGWAKTAPGHAPVPPEGLLKK